MKEWEWLRCADRGGKPEYYWRKDGKDVTGAYIPVDEREFAAALAQRNYDQAVLNYAKEELCLITKLAKKRTAHSIEGVYEEYGFARKALVNPVWIPDDEFVAKWQKTKYKKRVFKEEDPEYCADNLEKILDYERDGYFPGTHLIITHETHDKPVDTRLLEVIARHYLL